MNAVEFTTDLNASGTLKIPDDAASQLPKSGRARVIVLTGDADRDWQDGAYRQYLRDDAPEDADYESLK